MRILALDTSTELGAVGVLVDGEVRVESATRVRAQHGEHLMPVVARSLAQGEVAKEDLDLIVVGIGPGSFTGTRIGVATAQGLSIALRCPVVGVLSMHAVARGAPSAGPLAVVMDAHRGEVFAAAFEPGPDRLERLAPLCAQPTDAAERLARSGVHAVVGSGVRAYPSHFASPAWTTLEPVYDFPRGGPLARLGELKFAREGADPRLEPLYLRSWQQTVS